MKNRLSYKLISYIVIISFLITSISLFINLKNTYNNQINTFEKELNSIQKDRLEILSQSLWDVNTVAINIFLANLLNDERIIYAKIIENDNNIFEVGNKKDDNVIKKEFEINKQFKDEKYYIGKLIVIADLDPLFSQLEENAISSIIEELIKVFLISMLIIFFVKKFLTNSLEKMAEYANNLNLENLDKPLEIRDTKSMESYNELDIVTDSINTMRINLLEQIEQSRHKDNVLAHQSKMAAMGEMIGNIAHQWRQPLSVISTAATGIKVKKELDIFDEQSVVETMDSINEAAQYLSTTIDDFRNFFKPNKDKKYFNIKSSLDRTFSLISQQFLNKNIEIIKNIKDVQILGFENELVQVFINILNNSRDELVQRKSERLLIFIETHVKDNQLEILIKDNAGGINDDIIDRIFEPYFTTKDKNLGTGIGLYICEEIIVKHMQGTIVVENLNYEYENEHYKGAQFKIIFQNIKVK